MQSQFSNLWYRVERLVPRLSSHIRLNRHSYRGEIWYVITDPASGRVHRFTPAAYLIIGLMNGERTVHELWSVAATRLGDAAPTQDEMIHLLGQLHAADVLQCNVTPDTAEILQRYRQYRRTKKINPLLSPLSIRIPLFDPDKLLDTIKDFVRPVFGIGGALFWLALIGSAAVLTRKHWPELSADVLDQVLSPKNLLLIWLVFPFVKIIHEMGHALTTKVWGGEVHEMGVMLLVFSPVPYVDVSASAAFRSKPRRIIAAAAGMGVELCVASLALFAWINLEPGLLRNIAYNVILIAGVSTLLFNANPLVRFDGYYILSDLLEIPNLAQRSTAYFRFLTERYLFGLRDVEPEPEVLRERLWFVAYAVGSGIYRVGLLFAIIFGIAQKSLFIGGVLALWTAVTTILIPIFRGVCYLLNNPRLGSRRPRAVAMTTGLIAATVILVCLVPLPLRSQAEGVVWLPDTSFVRAGTDGFIEQLAAAPRTQVKVNEILVNTREPLLGAQVRVLEARVEEASSRHRAVETSDRVQAGLLTEQLEHQKSALLRARERLGQLQVKSSIVGMFVVAQAEDLPSRFVRKGEVIGYVVTTAPVTVRVIVPQENINLVRGATRSIAVRLAKNLGTVMPASLIRELPEALEHIPSKVLAVEGGGKALTDPRDSNGTKTFSRMFQFDIQLPLTWEQVYVGERVHVRFEHGWEPLISRLYRNLRQVLLSRLDV
jgi:putative peptide zinc metalloprotease protein